MPHRAGRRCANGGDPSAQEDACQADPSARYCGRGFCFFRSLFLLVPSMPRQRLLAPAFVILVMVAPGAALAQDRLAAIVKKKNIGRSDRARVDAEVAERVKGSKGLISAGTDKDRRESARQKLIATAQTPAATSAGLDAYARACAKHLAGLTSSERRETAFDAVWVLIELDNMHTAEALATALKSPHADVRFRAARGIELIHDRLGSNESACRRVLEALGKAGASEKQAPALMMIYQTIKGCAGGTSPAIAEECARAINAVFESRLRQLDAGKRNETIDQAGYEAAAACYSAASADRKTELVKHMARFLTHSVNRYFDPDTAPGYRPTLAKVINNAEGNLRGMIEASGKQAPDQLVGSALRGQRPTTSMEQSARAALADLEAVLQAPPWNAP